MRKLNVKKVRDLIALRGLTVSDFARDLGEQQQTVQKWTSGKRNPKPASLNKIAEKLGVSVSEISSIAISVSESKIDELNKEIDEINGLWAHLTEDQRMAVIQLVRTMANGDKQ